jgi:diguanylate cyclase (GGDEF)-like protein
MKRDRIKIIITVGFALLMLTTYSIWRYLQEESRLISNIDNRLYTAAVSVPFVLADDFHERAVNAKSISEQEDRQNIENLSRLNNRLKTKFLYTVIRDAKGTYRLSSSSALSDELEKGKEVRYFTPYPDAPDMLKELFENKTIMKSNFRSRREEYKALYIPVFSDRWGSYRSVFIPIRTANGNLYAVGADIDITNVKALLKQNTVKTILEFLFFLLIILPIIFFYIISLKRKHNEYQEVYRLYMDKFRLSNTDPLTQINNRLKLDEELQNTYAHYQRSGISFGLIMIDIDHFKPINDRYGHQTGDMVLKQFADLLNAHSRSTDTIGRWGGEEFMIIYRNADIEGAYIFAEKLRKTIEKSLFKKVEHISASFGVAQMIPGISLSQLLTQTDAALYSAKRAGRNCTVKSESRSD